MTFTSDWRFSEDTRAQIAKMLVTINPLHLDIPDVLGQFSINLNTPAAFSKNLRTVVEEHDPDLCDFLEIETIWDKSNKFEHTGLGYALASLRARKDSWDREVCKVVESRNRPGLFYEQGRAVAKTSALEGAMIWRDTYTNTPLCNDVFKDLAESVGCSGMGFMPIKVSDR